MQTRLYQLASPPLQKQSNASNLCSPPRPTCTQQALRHLQCIICWHEHPGWKHVKALTCTRPSAHGVGALTDMAKLQVARSRRLQIPYHMGRTINATTCRGLGAERASPCPIATAYSHPRMRPSSRMIQVKLMMSTSPDCTLGFGQPSHDSVGPMHNRRPQNGTFMHPGVLPVIT